MAADLREMQENQGFSENLIAKCEFVLQLHNGRDLIAFFIIPGFVEFGKTKRRVEVFYHFVQRPIYLCKYSFVETIIRDLPNESNMNISCYLDFIAHSYPCVCVSLSNKYFEPAEKHALGRLEENELFDFMQSALTNRRLFSQAVAYAWHILAYALAYAQNYLQFL